MPIELRSMQKMAEEIKKAPPSPARVVGTTLAGLATGTLAGLAGNELVDYALKRMRKGQGIRSGTARTIAPLIGGALGIAAPILHYAMLDQLRKKHEQQQAGKNPGQPTPMSYGPPQ